jgi:hypothetical protein
MSVYEKTVDGNYTFLGSEGHPVESPSVGIIVMSEDDSHLLLDHGEPDRVYEVYLKTMGVIQSMHETLKDAGPSGVEMMQSAYDSIGNLSYYELWDLSSEDLNEIVHGEGANDLLSHKIEELITSASEALGG